MKISRIIAIVSIVLMAVVPVGIAAARPLASIPTETLSLGDYYSCSLQSDQSVNCWGAAPPGLPSATTTFTQISAGGAHVCGILVTPVSGSNVLCWGDNTFGQSTPPTGVMFNQISAGWEHTCGVVSDGSLACWGSNGNGKSTPPSGTNYVQVTSGAAHSCALRTDEKIVCWGDNSKAQSNAPDAATDPQNWLQVDAGYFYTCALRDDNTVHCWGDDFGPDSNENFVTTPNITDPVFTQISAGYYHVCGLMTDQHVDCWGWNGSGESIPPSSVNQDQFSQVSAGKDHSCGLRTNGVWVCWGGNSAGQLDSYTISGNVGTSGALLSITGGSASVFADNLGNYTLAIPGDWTGTITPSKAGWNFTPPSKTYSTPATASSSGDNYSAAAIVYQRTFTSQGTFDGWIVETASNSKVGGILNASATSFQLGDDAYNRQYRALLSFKTSPLPDNAVITAATIRIRRIGAIMGTNPFTVLGKLTVDIRRGSFMNVPGLQLTDYNAASTALAVGLFRTSPSASWYSAPLFTTGRNNINKLTVLGGLTQFRLYFAKDNNGNRRADTMSFSSGSASPAAYWPQLVVTYTLP